MPVDFSMPVPGSTDPKLPGAGTSRGVFGAHPGMTPKYARNLGEREPDDRDSMARLFVQVGPDEFERFVASVPAESQALARVLAGTGEGQGGVGYIDFLLQSAPIQLAEKVSVVELLSDNHVLYTFGQSAPTFSYGGTLMNTKQDDWAASMLRIYRDMIRASQLARRKKTVRIRYDSYIVTGAAVGLTMNMGAEMEMAVSFNLTLIVKNILVLPNPNGSSTQLNTSFVPSGTSALPTVGPVALNTGVRPVRMRALPPQKTVAVTTQTGETGGVEETQATLDATATPNAGSDTSNPLNFTGDPRIIL